MPTHLDVLVGDYRRGVESNMAAVRADEKYLARNGAQNMYSFYRVLPLARLQRHAIRPVPHRACITRCDGIIHNN
jgi:hypothetical protein